LRKSGTSGELRFCTTHRHVRTQSFSDPRFLPHFVIGCLVTGGRDTGSFGFECSAVAEHLGVLVELLREVYGVAVFRVVLKRRGGYDERLLGVVENRVRERLAAAETGTAVLREAVSRVEIELEGSERREGSERGEAESELRRRSPAENSYYRGVQFKLYITVGGNEWEVADGGFVDWTQQLTGNRKERLMISGLGLELLFKMQRGLL
jgi:hypothetical protein